MKFKRALLACCLALGVSSVPLTDTYVRAADESFTRTEDVIYGRKHGVALTMDVFTPNANANGAAVVWVVSGGWFSSHAGIPAKVAGSSIEELLKRGYTVFAVVHGSQPKFTIPEILEDMNRAVRFIRFNAAKFKIDPDRIGITGGSAGGHLSLMQGVTGDAGNPKAADPIDRVSSRVQAVACFFPPTDFLNYGKQGEDAIGRGILKGFAAPFDFHEMDKTRNVYVPITDETKRVEIGRRISPIYHVTASAPPTLIIHGDKDKLVPIQQAETIVAKLKEAGVPAELVVKEGGDHGWPGLNKDMSTIADWFDKYLMKKLFRSGIRPRRLAASLCERGLHARQRPASIQERFAIGTLVLLPAYLAGSSHLRTAFRSPKTRLVTVPNPPKPDCYRLAESTTCLIGRPVIPAPYIRDP